MEQSREKISTDEAKMLIQIQWLEKLLITVKSYLEGHTRLLQQAVEELYDKYSVTLADILYDREIKTKELNKFLEELGYE